jgi:hypothetical protein
MSDEDINAGVAAVEAAIAKHFDDPNGRIELTAGFHAEAYLPPK